MNDIQSQWPAVSAVSATLRPHGYFVAKEGVSVSCRNGASVNIVGFGLSSDIHTAKQTAHFEFLERFWSFYPACGGLVGPTTRLPSYAWPDMSERSSVAAGSVLLGFKERGSKRDATGLACGTSIEDASERAVLELCERHILAKFWWNHGPSLRLFRTQYLGNEGMVAEYFTVDTEIETPFCLVTLQIDGLLWVVGSAMARTLVRAADKAFLEAAMLFDAMSQDQTPAYNSKLATSRYQRYVSGDFVKAEEKFLSKVNRQVAQKLAKVDRNDSLNCIVRGVLGEAAERVFITPVVTCSEFSIVSAYCDGSLRPCDFRDAQSDHTDPFF